MRRYHGLLQSTPLRVAAVPAQTQLARFAQIVGAADAHVVAAAVEAGADYLITLDQGLRAAVRAQASFPLGLTPGEFIRQVLPSHPTYSRAEHE